jgi:iron complex transport system ATP-binding protein
MKSVLKTYELSIGYGMGKNKSKVVHSDLDLELFPGEVTCLLGPNGSGKSTLIRTLAGFQPPLQGDIRILGKSLGRYHAGALAKIIGVVLTEHQSVFNMEVYSMVAFGRSPYTGFIGRLGKADHAVIEQSLLDAGIYDLRHRMFHSLSDGEKQKVFIAKSLAQETPLMFLDEPTAYLDFTSKVEIMQLIGKTAHKQQKAVLLSTHDLEMALQFADKIWLLANGKPLTAGVAEDLVLSGKFGSYFDHPNVRFDIDNGTFTFDSACRNKIKLVGSGRKMIWLEKALKRKGYETVKKDDPESSAPEIKLDENGFFEVKNGKTIINCKTIEEVLNSLE